MCFTTSSYLVSVLSVLLLLGGGERVQCFVSPQNMKGFRVTSFVRLPQATDTQAETSKSKTTATKQKKLGLLTFDLDDTLYPIKPVLDDANAAFARAMERFGYEGLTPNDIVETAKQIREEIAKDDPTTAAVLTHTEIRELAIRRELEKQMLSKKLKETADDWATPVDNLADVVVAHAKKYV